MLKEKVPEERRAVFEKGASAFAKKIVANFKDFEFVSPRIYAIMAIPSTSNLVHWREHEP